MKRAFVMVAVLFASSVCSADITWSGDVVPTDPLGWDLNTTVYVGNTGGGTVTVAGGSDLVTSWADIGRELGSIGVVTVDGAGSTWIINDQSAIGGAGHGTLNILNGGAVTCGYDFVGSYDGTGIVNVDGEGSLWINQFEVFVGAQNHGALNVTNGGLVDSLYAYIGGYGGTGVATVNGAGSTWITRGDMVVGASNYGVGSLDITDGGLVSVAGSLTIDRDGGGDNFISIATGGKLALSGDADDSLDEFMAIIEGTDAIRLWDGSSWADIAGAAYGIDYTLEYITDGELAGYTMLTVPEPATMMLLGLGGLLLRKRKA